MECWWDDTKGGHLPFRGWLLGRIRRMLKRSDTQPEVMKCESKDRRQRGAHLFRRGPGDDQKGKIGEFGESPNVLEAEGRRFRVHRCQPQAPAVGEGPLALPTSIFLTDRSLPDRRMQWRRRPTGNESRRDPAATLPDPGTQLGRRLPDPNLSNSRPSPESK